MNEINDGFVIGNESGAIIFANKALAQIHGFDGPEELIGRNLSELVPPEVRDEVMRERQGQIKTGKFPEIMEMPILRKDGSVGILELRPSPVIREGRIAGVS